MTNTVLKAIGAIYGTAWVGMYCWCFREHFRSTANTDSECEPIGSPLASRFYDEGGGFAGASEQLAPVEQSAAAEYEFSAGLKTAA